MSLASSPVRRRLVAATAAVVLAVASLAHCSNPSNTQVATSMVIGPGGGALASYDYVVEILVPPGALTHDETLSISQVTPPDSASALAPAYTIGPAGLAFAAPAVVSFAQGAVEAETFHDPTDLRVAAFTSGSWSPLANPSFDPLAGTLEGTTAQLGSGAYSVVIPSGGVCATVTLAGATCDPAYPGKCGAFAGAVVASCSATSSAATVSCCFPAGQAACFVQSEPDGCGSPCASFPGSTVESCVPDVGPPLGAGVPGGLPQSTCCFASGAAVCVAPTPAGCPAGSSASVTGACCYPAGTVPSSLPDGGAAVKDAGDGDSNTSTDDSGTPPPGDDGGGPDGTGGG
jgi:hypothetical protein